MTPQTLAPYIGVLLVGLILGAVVMHLQMKRAGAEGFVDVTQTDCEVCHRKPRDCCSSDCGGCRRPGGDPEDHRRCPTINWSKYVLKASIPPCPPQPDLSRYMLKSECPAPPDMSKYILKSAVPPCPPCISTCNKPCKIGECPPCPRPRCPTVECPPPTTCPPCAPVEPPRCPEPKVTCKADYKPEEPWMVRPLLASISPM
jgi:hypothetical protein